MRCIMKNDVIIKVGDLDRAYRSAYVDSDNSFMIGGIELTTGYAKYLLEYAFQLGLTDDDYLHMVRREDATNTGQENTYSQ